MGPPWATRSVTSLSGEGKDRIHSSWPDWAYHIGKTGSTYVHCGNNSEGPWVSKCPSETRRWQRRSGTGQMGAGYEGPGTALWEVDWLPLSTVTVCTKVTKKLLLINPVDVLLIFWAFQPYQSLLTIFPSWKYVLFCLLWYRILIFFLPLLFRFPFCLFFESGKIPASS